MPAFRRTGKKKTSISGNFTIHKSLGFPFLLYEVAQNHLVMQFTYRNSISRFLVNTQNPQPCFDGYKLPLTPKVIDGSESFCQSWLGVYQEKTKILLKVASPFICLLVWGCLSESSGDRECLSGVGSFLPQWMLKVWTQVVRPDGKCLCLLSHLSQ